MATATLPLPMTRTNGQPRLSAETLLDAAMTEHDPCPQHWLGRALARCRHSRKTAEQTVREFCELEHYHEPEKIGRAVDIGMTAFSAYCDQMRGHGLFVERFATRWRKLHPETIVAPTLAEAEQEPNAEAQRRAKAEIERQKILAEISSILRIPVARFIKRGDTDAQYELRLNIGGRERIAKIGSAAAVLRPATVRAKVLDATHRVIHAPKRKWPHIAQLLFRIVEIIETESEAALIREYVDDYIDAARGRGDLVAIADCTISERGHLMGDSRYLGRVLAARRTRTWQEVKHPDADSDDRGQPVPRNAPLADASGAVLLSLIALRDWLWREHGLSMAARQLASALTEVGIHPVEVTIRDGGQRAHARLWRAPGDSVSPSPLQNDFLAKI